MSLHKRTIGSTLLVLCFAAAPMALAADENEEFQGNVEITVRGLSQSGSDARYDEDFDGLDSGARLSNLDLEWFDLDSDFADYLSLDASGLGGDPYERAALKVGRRDVYDLRVSYRSQDYIYNLFDVVDDLDGSSWDSRRQFFDAGLTFHVSDRAEMFVEYQQTERDGSSQLLADVNTELYRFDSPLDQVAKRYSVGGRFELGSVDVLFRQMVRRYDYRINNSTADNNGLSDDNISNLTSYNWMQNDEGETDLTTLTISTPLGERVQLTASAFGTFLGDETIESDVMLNAEGSSFQGSCAISGALCNATTPCDMGTPGNFCVPDNYSVTDGTSRADIDADYMVLDADLSVRLRDGLDFHLQSRTLDREVKSTHLRDLDGNSVADDLEGTVMDTTPGSVTRVDYSVDTLTGLLDYAPSDRYRFRLGYRTISRELRRDGFEFGTTDYRNTPFESDSDDTVVLGITLKPVDWFRLDANREEGDITQAFTAVAPMETNRTRVRARFTPQKDLNINIAYSDYDNSNFAADFREADCSTPGADIDSGCWASRAEGETYSARISHRPTTDVDYWFSWTRSDVDSAVRVRFDTDLFLGAENGDSTYSNRSTELAAQINAKWHDTWSTFLRARINSADGSNRLEGMTFSSNIALVQDYSDVEAGLTYSFKKGVYVGARVRMFEYNDINDRLDYDGDIIALVAGMKL
jgi:hypothetical protein